MTRESGSSHSRESILDSHGQTHNPSINRYNRFILVIIHVAHSIDCSHVKQLQQLTVLRLDTCRGASWQRLDPGNTLFAAKVVHQTSNVMARGTNSLPEGTRVTMISNTHLVSLFHD